MKNIYLVRHTSPDVDKGVCYGQSDIDVKQSFYDEAGVIRDLLPLQADYVYSSPLLRCKKLASYLFPQTDIIFDEALKEINCGQWEMKMWDNIPKNEIDPWMQDFVRVCIPDGESYTDLYERATRCFINIMQSPGTIVIVTHGGVIRSLLSYISKIALTDSFNQFSLPFGCVVKISDDGGSLRHEMLSNILAKS